MEETESHAAALASVALVENHKADQALQLFVEARSGWVGSALQPAESLDDDVSKSCVKDRVRSSLERKVVHHR